MTDEATTTAQCWPPPGVGNAPRQQRIPLRIGNGDIRSVAGPTGCDPGTTGSRPAAPSSALLGYRRPHLLGSIGCQETGLISHRWHASSRAERVTTELDPAVSRYRAVATCWMVKDPSPWTSNAQR